MPVSITVLPTGHIDPVGHVTHAVLLSTYYGGKCSVENECAVIYSLSERVCLNEEALFARSYYYINT